jgi:RNA polymerase sigma factor (sigma-70 family)
MPDMSDGSIADSELLAQTARDPSAFGVFYDRYETAIVGYFLQRTRDPELAADLTAETFAAALGACWRFEARSSTAAPWLFTIAHNTLARSIRRGRVDAHARLAIGIRDAIALEPAQLDELDGLLDRDRADSLLASLPPDQREAVRARILLLVATRVI